MDGGTNQVVKVRRYGPGWKSPADVRMRIVRLLTTQSGEVYPYEPWDEGAFADIVATVQFSDHTGALWKYLESTFASPLIPAPLCGQEFFPIRSEEMHGIMRPSCITPTMGARNCRKQAIALIDPTMSVTAI